MNIYKRQMNDLGLNVEEYSKMLDIPKLVTEKMVNGNGEVVDNMEINNFLRKNIFTKHQEVENNKEEKKVEALNVKLMRGENSYETKKQWLLEKYPNSKEVLWYVNEYDRDTYFNKYNVKNKFDLMRRYTFTCNVGRLNKNGGSVGESTIDRLINKSYNELGTKSAYPLICQLYDCFKLGHIKEQQELPVVKKEKGKRGYKKRNYTEEEKELRDWFLNYDMEEFFKKKIVSYKTFEKETGVSYKSIPGVRTKKYIPRLELLKNIKSLVEKYETKIIPNERTAIVSEESIMKPFRGETIIHNNIKIEDIPKENNVRTIESLGDIQIIGGNEDILRSLLKDRLTEEEKTLIQIFGGRI